MEESEAIVRTAYSDYVALQRGADLGLAAILDAAARQADAQIRERLGSPLVSRKVRSAQLIASLRAIRMEQERMWGKIDARLQKAIGRAEDLAMSANRKVAAFLAAVIARENIKDAGSLAESFRSAAARGIEAVKARQRSRLPLSPKVYAEESMTLVEREVNKGLVLGESANDIAARVRGLIRPDTPGGVSYAARRLARTEINSAYHAANREAYEDQPFVTGMRWNLSRTHTIRDICDKLARADPDKLGPGVYKVPPRPPHPNDMCYLTPVTPEREEFLDAFFAGRYDDWLQEQAPERASERAPVS